MRRGDGLSITVSRGIVKWFKGREMAMAVGSEMALARLGVGTCMIFSPLVANFGGDISVSRSVAFGVVLPDGGLDYVCRLFLYGQEA